MFKNIDNNSKEFAYHLQTKKGLEVLSLTKTIPFQEPLVSMMLIRIVMLFKVIVALKTSPQNFAFLVEKGPLLISMGKTSERTSLVSVLNITDTNYLAAMGIVNAAYKKFRELPVLQGEPYKSTYKKAINPYMDQFKQAYLNLLAIYKQLDPSQETVVKSTCIFYAPVLDAETLVIDSSFLSSKTANLNPLWVPTDLKGDELLALESFIATFQRISSSWLEHTSFQLNSINSLQNKHFPENLIADLEKIKCLEKTMGEIVIVLETGFSKSGFTAELEFLVPTSVKEYIELIPVNYDNIQIKAWEPNQIFAEPVDGFEPVLLDCGNNAQSSQKNPTCIEVSLGENCKKALGASQIYESLKSCNFGHVIPPLISRLNDEGILIMGEGVICKENGKKLQADTPVLIYSKNVLQISQGDKEYKIEPNLKEMDSALIFSILTPLQIKQMAVAAYWGEIKLHMRTEDFLTYVTTFVEILLAPFSIAGFIFGLKMFLANRGKNTNTVINANPRRRNFDESRRLIALQSL